MQIRETIFEISRFGLLHLVVSAVFWVWMGAVALGYSFADHDRWSAWAKAQVYVVPKIALTLSFPGRLLFDQVTGGQGYLLSPSQIVWYGPRLSLRC